jgi:RES domain-containing protein
VRLDSRILRDLAVPFAPTAFVRVTPMLHAETPLGMSYGDTRFASPTRAFKVLYLAENLMTSIAEALVRDRFQGKAHRRLHEAEAERWGATSVAATRPLKLIDLRTTGLVRLGVSTEAARGKAQGQGRKLSQAVHDQTDADGLLYASRLTAAACICVFERAVPALRATPVAILVTLPKFIPALQALNVALEPAS